MKSNYVFVLDTNKIPQTPIHPAQARRLLDEGKAAVYRRQPFTIICKPGISTGAAEGMRLKLDPGSKTTGIALLMHDTVIWAAELTHRGQRIKAALDARRTLRRNRRNRKTRYRQPRFDNRRRPEGWLPPSLMHRVQTTMTWVQRLRRYVPVQGLSVENVRFDMQLMQNPEISGVEYQQGELAGYEVREYLLEKFGRTCVYCSAKDVPLEIDHIVPKSRDGSNRVGNLTIACRPCNEVKGNQTADEFGHPDVQAKARLPWRDAAAGGATRWRLYHELVATGLPVEAGTGGRTKYNRTRQGYVASSRRARKTHWLDAACVGASTPEALRLLTTQPLAIVCKGRGSRQKCRTDKYGFPMRHFSRRKRSFGFQTGDLVCAKVPKGKFAGRHVGRVTVRAQAHFDMRGRHINPTYCRLIQRTDGYGYAHGAVIVPGVMARGRPKKIMSVDDLAAHFPGIHHLVGRLSPASLQGYLTDASMYIRFCEDNAQGIGDPASLLVWRELMVHDTSYSPNTINRRLAVIKTLVKASAQIEPFAEADELAFRAVEPVKLTAMRHRLNPNARVRLEPEDVRRLCTQPDPTTMVGLRDRVLLHVLATSGCRISEAVGIDRQDLVYRAPQDAYFVQVTGKGRTEPRLAPLSKQAHEWIQRWLRVRDTWVWADPLFTAFEFKSSVPLGHRISALAARQRVKMYAEEIGLEHVKPHDLRRFVATQLAEKFGLRQAQLALGHSSFATTARYYVLDELAGGMTDQIY